MTDAKFDQIWKKSFVSRADLLLEHIGQDYLTFREKQEGRIRSKYISLKNESKEFMAKHAEYKRDILLDRHKIASLILCAIIYVRPFRIIKIDRKAPPTVRYVNELLGFICGLDMLKTFMVKDARLEDLAKPPVYQMPLVKPEIKPEIKPESYIKQTLKGIYHAYDKKKLDAFILANLFFLIEQYSITNANPISH